MSRCSVHNRLTTSESLIEYKLISQRLMSINLNIPNDILIVFQIYTPDSFYSDVDSDEFYEILQQELNVLQPSRKYIILGDFSAKVGK